MHSRSLRALFAIAACALFAGCAAVDVRRLAGDDTAGRNNNTAGSTTARQFLLNEIQPITNPVGGSYTHAINLGTNVLGVIPGTELPGKYVIVGAHYDHVGNSCTSKEAGDTICNGATDNAAGVAAALAIARDVARKPLRRSVIIAFWDREEDGLLGSLAYTQTPLVPLADTVAYVNFDIQGANLLPALRNTTFAVGSESGGTRFQDIVRAASDPQSLDTHLFSAIFGQGRSDYANFLNVDVPSVFFTDSTGPCYHTNQDEPGVVDYGKLDQQIGTALATTRELGNTTNLPAWTENEVVVYDDVVTFAGVVDLAYTNLDRFSASDQQTITNIKNRVDTIRDDGPDEFEQNDVTTLISDAAVAVNLLTRGTCESFIPAPGVARAMSHPNDELIERFYGAFARHDGDTMAACYAPDAHFSDPVFTDLHGEEPGAMWRMLTGRAEDLEIRLAEHEADDTRGSAHWLADYTFRTGRRVHNDVRAEFRFENGLIREHRDSFSFYAWSRQALGPTGLALGWTPIVRSKVQSEARSGLDEFLGR